MPNNISNLRCAKQCLKHNLTDKDDIHSRVSSVILLVENLSFGKFEYNRVLKDDLDCFETE